MGRERGVFKLCDCVSLFLCVYFLIDVFLFSIFVVYLAMFCLYGGCSDITIPS